MVPRHLNEVEKFISMMIAVRVLDVEVGIVDWGLGLGIGKWGLAFINWHLKLGLKIDNDIWIANC